MNENFGLKGFWLSLLRVTLIFATCGIALLSYTFVGYLFANLLTGLSAVVLYCVYRMEEDKKFKLQLQKTVIVCLVTPTLLFGLYFILVNMLGFTHDLFGGVF